MHKLFKPKHLKTPLNLAGAMLVGQEQMGNINEIASFLRHSVTSLMTLLEYCTTSSIIGQIARLELKMLVNLWNVYCFSKLSFTFIQNAGGSILKLEMK